MLVSQLDGGLVLSTVGAQAGIMKKDMMNAQEYLIMVTAHVTATN
jgi:hypothetical protein